MDSDKVSPVPPLVRKFIQYLLTFVVTMGIGLLVPALLLAGGAMWGLLPLPLMVVAVALGISGGVMLASTRPKVHLA